MDMGGRASQKGNGMYGKGIVLRDNMSNNALCIVICNGGLADHVYAAWPGERKGILAGCRGEGHIM